ncbi:glycoside hydrolase family 3 N-terminal domain-containing protein [Demetria terragena]|uniref:glycoside hydrolase family 3 N-terminal domain-containing protein n=1 Tax=Demetria terragena TaxID=63959 RepID=UPI000A039150|nr:glycoside hydrolase family 3 N-terminal domain-containing protein [Demetria terragena]
MRAPRTLAAVLGLSFTVSACSGSDQAGPTPPPSRSDSASTHPSTPASKGGSTSASTSRKAPASCVTQILNSLTPEQEIGQLLMVGLQVGTPTSTVTSLIRNEHVGNVIYLGGWEGAETVRSTSAQLQQQVGKAATGGLRLFIAADQEGGQIWQIRTAADRLPSALQQGKASPTKRQAYGKEIGTLLSKLGVNLNLAPVADTVPPALGEANEPIGRYERQYGNDPALVAAAVPDLIRGLHAGGVATTVKHFPGIGRLRGNTDFTTEGIEDTEATRNDPYLKPFQAGVTAGTDMVMMSTASYPKIDPKNQAVFSPTIIEGVLRKDLAFDGVVITDDVAAESLSKIAPAERATRYVAAGGDILLTGDAAEVKPMLAALKTKVANDPAFAKKVDAAVRRVVALKVDRHLATCD